LGRRYFEVEYTSASIDLAWFTGIVGPEVLINSESSVGWTDINTKALYRANGQIFYGPGTSGSSLVTAPTPGDRIGVDVNMSTKQVIFSLNGVVKGSFPFTQDEVFPFFLNNGDGTTSSRIYLSADSLNFLPVGGTPWSAGDQVGAPEVTHLPPTYLLWQRMEAYPLVDSLSGITMSVDVGQATPVILTGEETLGAGTNGTPMDFLVDAFPLTSGTALPANDLHMSLAFKVTSGITDGFIYCTAYLYRGEVLDVASIELSIDVLNSSAGDFTLGYIINALEGSFFQSVSATIPLDTWQVMEINLSGGNLTVLIGGALQLSGTVPVNVQGKFLRDAGAGADAAGVVTAGAISLDNFKIIGYGPLPSGAVYYPASVYNAFVGVGAPTITAVQTAVTTFSISAPSFSAPDVVPTPALLGLTDIGTAFDSAASPTSFSQVSVTSGGSGLSWIVWPDATATATSGSYALKFSGASSGYPSISPDSTISASVSGCTHSGLLYVGLTVILVSITNPGVTVSILASLRDGVSSITLTQALTTLDSVSGTFPEPSGTTGFSLEFSPTTIDLVLAGVTRASISRATINSALGAEATDPEFFMFAHPARTCDITGMSLSVVGP
jgi:hypothetical protein